MSTMKERFAPEPERYEFSAAPMHQFELARRDFFKVLGAGSAVFVVAKEALPAQETAAGSRSFHNEELPKEITSWLHVGEDGVVTGFTGKAEMGQNIRTSISQTIADELRVPFESVRLVLADTTLTPFDAGTFGSRTTPTMTPQFRRVAEAARNLLIGVAAKEWNVAPERLAAADAKVTDPTSKRSLSYAELARGKTLAQNLPAEDPITPASEWKIAGKPLPKVDGRAFVTGRHQYTSDIRLDGMLYGKVLRPPSFGATLTSYDDTAAKAMTGVTVVRDGDFIAVAAPSAHEAQKALDAIHTQWKEVPQVPSKEIFSHVAQWTDGKLTVWTGTQRPFANRDELASVFHIPESNVRVIVPDTGAAYGGKHTSDAAIEAARLARVTGKPVKVVWTREEEFTWAYFRPAGVIEVSSGVTGDGKLTAWEFHNYHSGMSGIETPYDVANQLTQYHQVPLVLRSGSYRGLAATANHFARETHMDALARVAKMDSLEFRLKNLSDVRMRAVLEAAAKSCGWPRKKTQEGQGFGLACGAEKGSYVATCAEVAVDRASGSVRVVRAVEAFECGAIVNPDGLRNQVVGAIIQGLGGALFEAVEFENGHIKNPHFSAYRVPRFRDVPEIEAVLLDRKDIPSAGAGETPIMTIAPAVGNALFDATGIRLNNLPLVPNGLRAA